MNLTGDTAVKYIPLLTGYIIVAAISRLIVYYLFFDIRVVEYLDLSECLTMFLDDLLMCFSITIGTSLIVYYIMDKMNKKEEEPEITTKSTTRNKRNARIIYNLLSVAAIVFIFIQLAKIHLKFALNSAFFVICIMLMIFSLKKIIIQLYRFSNRHLGRYLNYFELMMVITPLLLLMFFSLYGFSQANDRRYRSENRYFHVMLKDNTEFRENNSIIYLGRTRNYMFLYYTKSGRKKVIPMSEVKEFQFK